MPPPPAPYGLEVRRGMSDRNRIVLIIGASLLTLVIGVVGWTALTGGETKLTYAGETIDEPEQTLTAAESNLRTIVEDRHGATNDDTRCYFAIPQDAERDSDVGNLLRCGPVLFVDGDPEQPYLSFRLGTNDVDGGVQLVADEVPESPQPEALPGGETLRRPDGKSPPAGSGGLEPPPPPRAEAGLLEAHDLEDVRLEEPEADARMVSWSTSLDVVGLAQPERVGRGDSARRPAEGEKFVAAQIEGDFGAGGSPASVTGAPEVSIQIGDDEPVPAPEELTGPLPSSGLLVSMPEDTDRVDLIVNELDVEQRISLLTGEPGGNNVAVLRRENREQALDARQDLGFTASTANGSGSFNINIHVQNARLGWFEGPDGRTHPESPGNAYLVMRINHTWDSRLAVPGNVALDLSNYRLALPDGTAVGVTNLAPDPEHVVVAFGVPADFTEGRLTIGGRATVEGVTIDFGASRMEVPISIPAG